MHKHASAGQNTQQISNVTTDKYGFALAYILSGRRLLYIRPVCLSTLTQNNSCIIDQGFS